MTVKKITKARLEKTRKLVEERKLELEKSRNGVAKKHFYELEENIYRDVYNQNSKEVELSFNKKLEIVTSRVVNLSIYKKYPILVREIEQYEGKVVKETDKFITIKTKYNEQRIYKEHILFVAN